MVTNILKEIRMQQYMMNKRKFCELIGVSEQQYARYENSIYQPSLEVVLRISKALEKNVNDIWKLMD